AANNLKHVRDSDFYYNHKIVVLLVQNTLFRLQASLLAPDPDVGDYELKPCMKDALDLSESGTDMPGISDEHPIVLPEDIGVRSFRSLLILLSGGTRITDTRLATFLSVLNNNPSHSPEVINDLSRVGYLASRFGIWTIGPSQKSR
ncbi:unnamed protein product, partial [Rhizoctonia solani]